MNDRKSHPFSRSGRNACENASISRRHADSLDSIATKTVKYVERSEGYKALGELEWRDAVYSRLVEGSPNKSNDEKTVLKFLSLIVSHAGNSLAGLGLFE